jgi:hypothetical protein
MEEPTAFEILELIAVCHELIYRINLKLEGTKYSLAFMADGIQVIQARTQEIKQCTG